MQGEAWDQKSTKSSDLVTSAIVLSPVALAALNSAVGPTVCEALAEFYGTLLGHWICRMDLDR